jgi:ArsR family transcriptional regulator, arsenate/arsenite/antimonite-responsive transcriptional repressor
MHRSAALTALSALANDARLDLVRLLIPLGQAGLSAGEISRKMGLAASRLSFHLATLEQARLIKARKEGRHVFYAVDPAGLGATIGYLMNDCCMDHPEVMACCRHGNRTADETPVRP